MNPEAPRLWLLKLVIPTRSGRFLSALLIFVVLFVFFERAGALEGPDPSIVVLFFSAIIAYIIPVFHLIVERATNAFAELESCAENADRQAIHFDRRTLSHQCLLAGAGLAIGLCHVAVLFAGSNMLLDARSLPTAIVVIVGTVLVWVVVSSVVSELLEFAFVFRKLAESVVIDLLQIHQLKPFGQISTTLALSMVGAQAVLPIMFLDGFNLYSFLPGFIALLVPMIIMVLIPLLPVRRAIISAKTAALAQINEQISQVSDDAIKHVATVTPLLDYRRHIEEVPEWPIDFGVASRFALYLLIPPLTWVGAALIENVVDTFL